MAIYKGGRGFETQIFCETNPATVRVGLELGSPGYKSNTLTARPRRLHLQERFSSCLPIQVIFLSILIILRKR